MKNEEKIIMYDSDEAAQFKTVTGWVSSDGRFFGKDENLARYAGSTHSKCECGNIKTKGWTLCETCRSRQSRERYLSLPYEEYTGQPVYSETLDRYFFNADDIKEAYDDLDGGTEDLELVVCRPQYLSQINFNEYWEDVLPEDWDIEDVCNKDLLNAIDNLNKLISEAKPASWTPGKIRTSYSFKKD